MLTINGKTYEVQKAALHASFTDASYESRSAAFAGGYVLGRNYSHRFCWKIEICALEDSANRASKEIILRNRDFSINLSSWKDIVGQKLIWKGKYKMHNGSREYAGDLAFHGTATHNNTYNSIWGKPISSGTLEFLERKTRETEIKIKTRWSGFQDDLSFLFEGEVDFGGITAYCQDISRYEKVREEISKFINMDEFSLYEFKVNSTTFERGDPWGSSGLFIPLAGLH